MKVRTCRLSWASLLLLASLQWPCALSFKASEFKVCRNAQTRRSSR